MDIGGIISVAVTIVRLLVPFTIFRWPLGGAVLSIAADTFDWTVFQRFGFGFLDTGTYQHWDKLLDTWYLCILVLVVHQWGDSLAKRVAIILFAWRLAGVIVFELTGFERTLVFAPNIFEYFYLLRLIILKWFPSFPLTPRRIISILIGIGVPKVIQEISLHWPRS